MLRNSGTTSEERAQFQLAAWNRRCDRIDALNRDDPWLQRTARIVHGEPEAPAQHPEGEDRPWQGAVEPIVSVVWFKPDDLYTGDAFHTFLGCSPRTPVTGTWANLCRWLSRSVEGDPWLRPDLAKRATGAWVPGRYTGTFGRKDLPREFLGTRILVADVDSGDPYAVAQALAPYRAVIHSTYKNKPTSPRCRAVILLATEITNPKHYDIALRAVADYLNSKGFKCPASDSTLGKLAFLPMHQRGITPVFRTTSGALLDVARLVRAEEDRRRLAPPPRTHSCTNQDHAGAVRHAAELVAAAPEGERHNTRRNQARWLSELGVPDDAIRAACLDASSDDNAVRTVEWAIKRGREVLP